MNCALQIVTTQMKGNKLGVVAKGSAESSKNRRAEALKLFIAADNARASVTMYQMNECLGEVCKKIGVKSAGQKVAGTGKLA